MLVCGVINWDMTLFVDSLPQPGEEVLVERATSFPGGKGANTAVAAAKILNSGDVVIVGMLGSDNVADRQISILEHEGIDTSCIMKQDRAASGYAYVIVDKEGENMILTQMAANQMMKPETITSQQQVYSAVDQADMIIIIDPPLDVANELIMQSNNIRREGNKSKTIVWSPAFLVKEGFSVLHGYLNNVDYVVLNEQEAKSLAPAEDGIQACVKISNMLSGKRVVTTLGQNGCVLCYNEKRALIPMVDLSLFGLRTISTVGAGDTFLGTFGAFKLRGFDDIESLFMANIAAALKTTKEETRGSPAYNEIRQYMDDARMRSIYRGIKIL